jgi:hypothetical protein
MPMAAARSMRLLDMRREWDTEAPQQSTLINTPCESSLLYLSRHGATGDNSIESDDILGIVRGDLDLPRGLRIV